MLRRIVISAALAALTVPIGAVGAQATEDDGGAAGVESQQAVRAAGRAAADRSAKPSRRAGRAESDTPLSVSIDQLTPSTIPERGVVRVSGTVTNTDRVPWRMINVYAFVSDEPMTNAAQLDAAAASDAESFVGNRIVDQGHYDTIDELAPGDSEPFTFSVPRRLLAADSPGVYWFGVHALGEGPDGREELADGRARTFLPLVPPRRDGQLPTAVVVPLRHPFSYEEDGSLGDLARWTQTLSPGGRLRSLVDFGAGAGDRTVNWVIDPALVDAVRRLAAGNPPRSLAPNLEQGQDDGEPNGDGETQDPSASTTAEPSATPTAQAPEDEAEPQEEPEELEPEAQTAAEAAQAWLDRLREATQSGDQVLALPYGDTDVAAAARHDPALYERAVARAGDQLAPLDVRTSPVVSSPSGFLDEGGLLATDPDTTVLLTDAMFARPAPAVATTQGHRVVVTSTGAADGGPGPDDPMAITAMRQRLLSEAAVRFLRNDREPLVMVAPHDWNPGSPAGFFSGLDADWLNLTDLESLSEAATVAPVAMEDLRYPGWQTQAELAAANFESAQELMSSGDALQSMLTLNNLVSGPVTDQALGSVSYSARLRPDATRAATDRSREWIDSVLSSVTVSAPAAVTLSSSSGRFATTITNELDQPVTVGLEARTDGRLAIGGPRRVDIPAGGRATVLLTARTDENGIHEVTLVVTDKRGRPLGASTELSLRSAQVSNVIWLFMSIGVALLFGAIAVRLFRRLRDARRHSGSAEDAAADRAGADEGTKEPAEAGSR